MNSKYPPHCCNIPSQLDRSIETSRSEKEQDRKSKQIEVINQEMEDTEALRQQADKTIKLLEHEFLTCVDKGEKENDMSLVSKAMAMKRKSKEKQTELSEVILTHKNVQELSFDQCVYLKTFANRLKIRRVKCFAK